MQSSTRTLKKISLIPYDNKAKVGSPNVFVPSLLLSNIMSLAPKIDKVRNVSVTNNLDIICNVEFWLQNHIHDNIVHVLQPNKARQKYKHSWRGLCLYPKDN